MSERNLSQLLDRAVEHAPVTGARYAAGEQVLAAGRRRVRQRRTTGAGMGIAGLALAGALWSSLGGSGLLGADVAPAGQTTSTGAVEQPAPPVVPAADQTVVLRAAGDGSFSFSNGVTTIGDITLELRTDGTSEVTMEVDGVTTTVPGEEVGGMTVFRTDRLAVVTFPVPDTDATSSPLGVGEALGARPFTVDGTPMASWITSSGSSGAHAPTDVLLTWADRAQTLSGTPVLTARVQDQLLWEIPATGTWGLNGPDAASSTSAQTLMFGGETEMTWAARVPAEATAVQLVAPEGEVLATAEWSVALGDHLFSGGPSTWDLARGGAVEWTDEEGARQAQVPTATGTGDFAGLVLEIPPEQGREVTVTHDGAALTPVPSGLEGDVSVFPFPGDPAHELVVLPAGIGADAVLAVLAGDAGQANLPAPDLVVADQTLEVSSGRAAASSLRLLKVQAGTFEPGGNSQLVVQYPQDVDNRAANTWHLLGSRTGGYLVIDPGLVVVVSPDQGWLLHPQGDTSDGAAVRGGVAGQTLLERARDDDPETVDLVAVLDGTSDATLIVPPGFRVETTHVHEGPVDGYAIFTATVSRPIDGAPAGAPYGLDTDGDGQVDLAVATGP